MRLKLFDRRSGLAGLGLLSIVLLLLSAHQSPATASEPQVLDKSELVLESGDRSFQFEVELADEPEERRVGLMHRREMAAAAGMLFDFGQNQQVSMWMRNTHIPLDMLFIDEQGQIVNIGHNTVPHSEEIVASNGPVRYVLEVPAGTSHLLGIKPGDMVRHEAIGNIPDS
jgi:uncharacterized membrane protein (UPF0127 family)